MTRPSLSAAFAAPWTAEEVRGDGGKRRSVRLLTAVLTALLLAGCAGRHELPGPAPAPKANRDAATPRQPVSDTPVKIGPPYQVAGRWYVPADARAYDEVGVASWYGPSFHGGRTANGERYDMDGVSAAHKTLPLPSYVEVTVLATGRTALIRVNDRGPFVNSRMLDLSRGAARLLGVERSGVAAVRVRRVDPGEADRLALRLGRAAAPRPDASPTMLANLRARLPTPLAAGPSRPAAAPPTVAHRLPGVEAAIAAADAAPAWLIQVAALADRDRAARLAASVAGLATVQPLDGPPFRVRIGPFGDEASAEAALAQLKSRGYAEARLVSATGAAATQTARLPTDPTP